MAERRVRIGILQLESHPAVVLGDLDLLREPLPAEDLRLASLARQFPEIRPTLDAVKRAYIEWLAARLTSILSQLSRHPTGAPDILLLPECAAPREVLGLLKDFALQNKTLVLAGTHSPGYSREASDLYKTVGIRKNALLEVQNRKPATTAVLPILGASESILRPKLAPSVFEQSEVRSGSESLPTISTIEVPTTGLTLGPLICAEALRRPQFDKHVDLVAIVAYEKQPERFAPHAKTFLDTKTAVALANDGRFGGSGIFVNVDQRSLGRWWFEAPNNGRLPMGEGYVEVEIDLSSPAAQVGVATPAQSGRLVRLCSIHFADSPNVATEQRALAAAEDGNSLLLAALIKELNRNEKLSGPLPSMRWRYLEGLLSVDNLTPDWIGAIGHPIVTTGVSSLSTLEARLARVACDGLKALSEGPAGSNADNEALGQLFRTIRSLEQRTADRSSQFAKPRLPAMSHPFDRAEQTLAVRQALADENQPIVLLTGLPGIGKTTIASTALQQSGTDYLWLDCKPGVSADYVFEFLIRASGRIPASIAPRESFEFDELEEALISLPALVLTSSQNLFDNGRWTTTALELLFSSVIEIAIRTKRTKLIFESIRDVPLGLPLGTQMLRRKVEGLPEPDAIGFLQQQLRRAGLSDEMVAEEQCRALVRLVDRHPSLLILTADACAKEGIDGVLKDLKGRGKFYQTLVRSLLSLIGLTPDEQLCLAAVGLARYPIPTSVLDVVLPPENLRIALSQLASALLIQRESDGEVQVAPLLKNSQLEGLALPRETAVRFHRQASDYFQRRSRQGRAAQALSDAIEANYHAALAGISPPCDVRGLRDGFIGAAREHHQRERFADAVALLEPMLAGSDLPEDLLALLADSYFWAGQLQKGLDIADRVLLRNRTYSWLYTEAGDAALRAGQFAIAEDALARADRVAPGDYRATLLRGRLADKRGRKLEAEAHYREAVNRTKRNAWPFFYLARCLRWLGRPEDALRVIDDAREFVDEHAGGRMAGRLESAILCEEAYCLLLTGDDERARALCEFVFSRDDTDAEATVSAAYLRAVFVDSGDAQDPVQVFDQALKKINKKDSVRAHTRASIALYRGKLCQRLDDNEGAQAAFEDALDLDPHNLHIKVCLLRALTKRITAMKRLGDQTSAKTLALRANEVAKGVLAADPVNKVAIAVREDIYLDFDIR